MVNIDVAAVINYQQEQIIDQTDSEYRRHIPSFTVAHKRPFFDSPMDVRFENDDVLWTSIASSACFAIRNKYGRGATAPAWKAGRGHAPV